MGLFRCIITFFECVGVHFLKAFLLQKVEQDKWVNFIKE